MFCQLTALDAIKVSSHARWKANEEVYALEAARINQLMDENQLINSAWPEENLLRFS